MTYQAQTNKDGDDMCHRATEETDAWSAAPCIERLAAFICMECGRPSCDDCGDKDRELCSFCMEGEGE